MKRTIVLAAAAAFTVSACSGLKDALNAHTDWVARAGSTELSVTKLANMLGKSRARRLIDTVWRLERVSNVRSLRALLQA